MTAVPGEQADMAAAIATGDVLGFGSWHQKPIKCVIPICVQLFVVSGFVFGITAHNVVAVWTESTLSVVVGRFFFRETIREKLFCGQLPDLKAMVADSRG